jgi:hypothetical protein
VETGSLALVSIGGGGRLAITQAGARENIKDILSLGEVEAMGMASNQNSQEMIERAEVFHGKLTTK